jgi:hypothetical protein
MSSSSEPTILPDSSSYMELAGLPSGQSSSPAESAIGDTRPEQISSSSWRLDRGPDSSISSPTSIHEPPIVGYDSSVSAHSDTHPDVVASLVSEYIADTILRIDSGAVVDLAVTVKQDLVVISGEVGCSHPAKSAIIHSDQFMGTLNGSIRDILKEIGFTSSQPPPVSSIQPVAQNSPLRKPVSTTSPGSPKVNNGGEEDALIDPSLVHIVLALTDNIREARPSGVFCEARASEQELTPVARLICREVTKYLETYNRPIPGGVSVDILPDSNQDIKLISISFFCPSMNSEFLKDISQRCVSKEYLKSISPHVHDDAVIDIRHSARNRTTGRSFAFTGKSWDDPRRYGHVLARQEALYLVKSGACSKCEIKLRLEDTTSVESDIRVLSVNVYSFGSSKEADLVLAKKVLERFSKRTIKELQESVLKEPTSSCFALGHGGSLCHHEFVVDSL